MDVPAPTGDGELRTAYGLGFPGLPDVPELARAGPGDTYASVRVRLPVGAGPAPDLHPLDPDRYVRRLLDGRVLELDRRAGSATFHGPPLDPGVLAHPYLGPVATTFSRWCGRESFHAGAFLVDDRAWVVLGPRTAGKSSLLAALADRRLPVLSDDLLVTDGRDAFAGPRCVDLRRPLPAGSATLLRTREDSRWRRLLPAVPARVALGGWIYLRWGPGMRMRPLPVRELIRRLATGRAGRGLPSDPSVLLGLAGLPSWELERPQEWSRLDETLDRVLATVAVAAAAPALVGPGRRAGS